MKDIIKNWLGDLYDDYIEIVSRPPKTTNTEKHHILPRTIFPEYENSPGNIVVLDVLDHLLAHEILAKTKDPKMILAFWFMFSYSERRYSEMTIDIKEELLAKYTKARTEMKKVKSDWGKTLVGEKNPFFGKHHGDYAKRRASETHKGKKLTDEHTKSFGQAQKGIPKRKLECPHCHKLVPYNLINRWHNNNCKFKED
ncbi:MobE mobile endonuclease [Yersinia phage phiR1-RT]|uniref:MobE mobile endonuclease n=1 Tax=Yersinia phage phiR1-RT TaxID=1206558 RepID=I7LEN2_BPPR1|nr:MobE mobile endonuclease [Yersinia phage phiR1-RT]CCI88737.1 MobE mobile endonuclease [Yersinia phage phiR1-RT]